MNGNIQNPFGELPLGRWIEEREVYALPSGRELTRFHTVLSAEDPPGIWRTLNERDRIEPPLSCGCNPPGSLRGNIQECLMPGCSAIVCRRHSFDCPKCGLVVCAACAGQIVVPDQMVVPRKTIVRGQVVVAEDQIVETGRAVRVCKRCQEEAETPKWLALMKSIFRL